MGSSNRRWFTIDEENGELALSYCKRPNSERSGWLFLSDVLSIAQDQATNFITIEHPSRILRIQSPTPAQHRVWFSTLSKCCNGVVASPSSPDRDRRPSLPYFMNAVSPARRNSVDAVPSTPADQLKFLREITRGRDASSDKENEPKIFSPSSNESIASKDFDIQEDKHAATKATPRSIVKDLEGSQSKYQLQQSEIVDFPDVKQTTNRIHEYTKISTENKENESEVGNCEDVCSFHASSVDSTDLSVDGANDGAQYHDELVLTHSTLNNFLLLFHEAVPVKKQFDMNSMKLALKRADDTSSHSGFHISTSTDLLDVEPRKKVETTV